MAKQSEVIKTLDETVKLVGPAGKTFNVPRLIVVGKEKGPDGESDITMGFVTFGNAEVGKFGQAEVPLSFAQAMVEFYPTQVFIVE